MRPSLAVSLLILSLLISQAQGIRLDKGSFLSGGHKIKLEENGDLMKTGDKVNIIVCKDGDEDECNSGKTRKLTTINTSTSTTTTNPKKNDDPPTTSNTSTGFGREEETRSVNFPVATPASGHREQFPDIVDIAEMDYSPARRKPPIHN